MALAAQAANDNVIVASLYIPTFNVAHRKGLSTNCMSAGGEANAIAQ